MKRKDVLAFLGRDWAWVAQAKEAHWIERKRRLGVGEALRVMDELRRQAQGMRPGWPTAEDREEDLEAHRRLAAKLAQTAPLRRR